MAKRNKKQILTEKLKKLEYKKEDRINKYILPLEIAIEGVREQIHDLEDK
jgi:hypothetical protein